MRKALRKFLWIIDMDNFFRMGGALERPLGAKLSALVQKVHDGGPKRLVVGFLHQ
jgi:hypothetical protein